MSASSSLSQSASARFRRAVAWVLIALMASPLPAAAQVVSNTPVRDTAIYLAATPGGTSEPNILLVLGTNDRMNIPEPWREYPGAYDSFVEYLWADLNVIVRGDWNTGLDFNNPNQTGENFQSISLFAPPVNPTSRWGHYSGTSVQERFNLLLAAYFSTVAAFTGDPGPRWAYRNYGGGASPGPAWVVPSVWGGDPNWVFWAPAGTVETSPLLWSASFNKFAGGTHSVGGVRGGINFGAGNSWLNRNQCQASHAELMPNTVFAPSAYPRNSGKFLNRQWARWEPFLDLDNSMVAAFPAADPGAPWGGRVIQGASGTGNIGSRVWPRPGYASSNLAAPNPTMESGPDYWPWWMGPNNLSPAQNPGNGDRGFASLGNTERWTFQSPGAWGAPIRMLIDNGAPGTVQPGDSRSGWSSLRADSGGYNHWGTVSHLLEDAFSSGPGVWNAGQNPLTVVLQQYGIAVNTATPADRIRFAAMRGNRDVAGTDWWKVTGASAYFSTSVATGSITAGSSTLTINRNAAFWAGQRINVPGAGTAGGNLLATISAVGGAGNRTLTLSAPAATTIVDTMITVNLKLFDRESSSCTQWCGDSEAAQPATNGQTDAWGRTLIFRSTSSTCVAHGVSEGAPGVCAATGVPACGAMWSDDYYKTTARSGCYWTGRSTVFVEGVGNVTHGGTCMANCAERFPHIGTCSAGGTSASYCGAPGAPDRSFNGVTFVNAVINDGGNGSSTGCGAVNIPDWQLNCTTREGTPCQYQRQCISQTAWDSPPNTDFAVVNRARFAGYLVHDCTADNGSAGNFGGFMSTRTDRTFGAEWNSTVSNAADGSAAYVPDDTVANFPAIDVYSTNYLNWKFGPRGPNGHPIGRATRLTTAKSAIGELVMNTNGVRFGLMVTNRTRADLTNDGGNVAFGMRRMGTDALDPDYANRAQLVTAINSVVASSRTPITETLYEAMLYFSGRAPQWGADIAPAFIGGQASQGRDATAVCTTGVAGTDCPQVGVYRSPMLSNPTVAAPASCQKNFVVMITNGVPEDDWSANTLPGSRGVRNMAYNSVLPQPVGVISPVAGVDSFNPATASGQFESAITNLPYGLLDQGSNAFDGGYLWLDELAYFMRNADMSPGARAFAGDASTDLLPSFQGVVTYTIGFRGATSPVVQQAAVRGDGLYYEATDASDLRNRLQQAITNITSFSGTVAAATVPLAAYNRTESSLDVYLAFFEPSPNRAWRGTLKRYRLGITQAECGNNPDGTASTLCLTGQTDLGGGVRNIATQEPLGPPGLFTDVINALAVSFWNPLSEVDGRNPARGGTGFQLKSQGALLTPHTRSVYTKLSSSASLDLTNAQNRVHGSNAGITNAMLGLGLFDPTGRHRLLNFIRGGDMTQASCNGAMWFLNCTTWADWPHGDVLHSKPAQVYYDVGSTPPVQFLYYLTNDGLLRAVDANTGVENWAFLVEEAIPKLGDILANGNGEQIQAADGSPAVYVKDLNGNGIIEAGDQVILTFNLRRGGRSMYALDVTNRNSPRFLWKITGEGGGQICTGVCASEPLYAELGQTWSNPVVGRVAGSVNPVAIFGGGYDPNQDNEPVTAADTMGRALFVIDLITGVPIKRFDSSNVLVNGSPAAAMVNSVPSTPAANDINGDGLIDRVYIGDTAGKLFRFQMSDPLPANWQGKLLAELSDTSPPNRKILFPPTIVSYLSGGSRLFGVFVGTGDREHPFKLNSSDMAAMIVDRDVGNLVSASPPVLFNDVSFVKMPWDDLTGQANIAGGATGWARLFPATVKATESPNVQNDLLRLPVYGRTSSLGFPALTSTCTPSFISRVAGYAGLDGRIIILPGNGTQYQLFQGNLSQNFIGAAQVLFLPDGRIVLFHSGGSAGSGTTAGGAGSLLGMRGQTRNRVYWYVEPGI